MFINQIDKTIDTIIDQLYLYCNEINILSLLKNKKKFISDIDNLYKKIDAFINNIISLNEINNLITYKENFDIVQNIISNYIYVYTFLLYGYNLKSNDENFTINDFLDLIINCQSSTNGKLKDFLIAQNIYILQNNLRYIFDILKYLIDDKYNINNDTRNFIQSIDKNIFKLLIIDNIDTRSHNIIKLIIFKNLYISKDKNIIYNLIEKEYESKLEYKYIDVIDSKYEAIDFSSIENLFNYNERESGLPEELYKMILNYDANINNKNNNIEYKINKLFDKKILIPITEDFLRYHKEMDMNDNQPGSSTKIDIKEKNNKKDNTKIRYIVTKINKLMDIYNPINNTKEKQEELNKLYYQPLMHRRALVMNEIDELNIIKKINSQGKTAIDNNEYYDELVNIRNYPYLNFKHLSKDGISLVINNSIHAIRYCNFENINNFAQNLNNNIQSRLINQDVKSNIVGLSIGLTNINLGCIKLKNTINTKKIHKNGLKVMIHNLKKILIDKKIKNKLLYWLFDNKTDKYNSKNNNNLTSEDHIYDLLSYLYNKLMNIINNMIVDEFNKTNFSSIYQILNYLKDVQEKYISLDSKYLSDLNMMIYYNLFNSNKIIYDENENKIPGLSQTLIKLPLVKREKLGIAVITILKKDLVVDKIIEEIIYDNAYCQHLISWNYMHRFNRSNPNKFNQLLYEFTKKYIVSNSEGDFICKSCYQLLEIKKYVTSFNDNVDNVAIIYSLDTDLEEIPEYNKFNKVIKNLDKQIEKITYIVGLLYFVGSTPQYKIRRHGIIKNIIDLIELQFKTLYFKDAKARKERLDIASQKYRFNKELTNFFLFKMDNDIFTYSSKETDKFKMFKLNNIITYLIFFLLLDINQSQIPFFSNDKIVNYYLFEKFGFNLFDNFLIRIDNTNNLVPIKKYKLLCYVIYYISGIIVKYNLWYSDSVIYKSNNINIQLHRLIITTFIDLLNTIIETNMSKNKNFLYEIFSIKFFQMLKNTYFNNIVVNEILNILENQTKKKITIDNNKIKYNNNKIKTMPIIKYINDASYLLHSNFGLRNYYNKLSFYLINKYVPDRDRMDALKNNYNILCDSLLRKTIIKYFTLYNDQGIRVTNNLVINKDQYDLYLKKNIKDYEYLYNIVTDIRLKITKNIKKKNDKKYDNLIKRSVKNSKIAKILINTHINKSIEFIIDEFINYLEKFVDKSININNLNLYLKDTVYFISNDYIGNKINEIITQNVTIKNNDQFFKQDILFYNDKNNNVTMFYSLITKQYLGYKEQSKDYTLIKNSSSYIKINHSIRDKLQNIGFNYIHYNVSDMIDNNNLINIIENLLKNRLNNLKNCISETLQIIYQLKNKFHGLNEHFLIKFFDKKINNINTYDENLNVIFDKWNRISESIFIEALNKNIQIDIINLSDDVKFININSLLKIKSIDHVILIYYINNLKKLIELQDDDYQKNNMVYLIINIINHLFNKFNFIELSKQNNESKKLIMYLNSNAEVVDMPSETANLTSEQLETINDEKLDEIGENEVYDMDIDDELDENDEDRSVIRNDD